LKKIRISIGPGEIAGYFSNLKSGFDDLGVPCEHFSLLPNKFGYPESDYFLRGIYLKLSKLSLINSILTNAFIYPLQVLLRLVIFVYAIIRYDVFIFSGFGSFFKFYELPLLKLLKRKVIVVYLGSDARPSYLSGRYLDDFEKDFEPSELNQEVVRQVRLIRKVEKYADIIVNHTATSQLFLRNFVRLHAVGMPVRGLKVAQFEVSNQSNSVRILHAPSRPNAKGTFFFRQVIEELRIEGYSIDFVELINVPNCVVLEELSRCDFVLDELFSDVPMAMLATEAAMYAKPVVVGGYYAEQYVRDNPSSGYPPALFVLPSEIKNTVRKLIDEEVFRLKLGKQAASFIEKKWSAKVVAGNYMRLVDVKKIPSDWICNPLNLSNYWGWGLSKQNWRAQLSKYISLCGSASLQLEHHPHLKQEILNEVEKTT